jgi:hypothetical protein
MTPEAERVWRASGWGLQRRRRRHSQGQMLNRRTRRAFRVECPKRGALLATHRTRRPSIHRHTGRGLRRDRSIVGEPSKGAYWRSALASGRKHEHRYGERDSREHRRCRVSEREPACKSPKTQDRVAARLEMASLVPAGWRLSRDARTIEHRPARECLRLIEPGCRERHTCRRPASQVSSIGTTLIA